MARPTEYGSADDQLAWVSAGYESALDSVGLGADTGVFRRFFCSDLPNQADVLRTHPFSDPDGPDDPCAVSWVCQSPTPPAKCALWAYHVSDPGGAPDKSRDAGTLALRRGELTHLWTTGVTCVESDSSLGQTEGILRRYDDLLRSQGLSLADNVLRTWFFVQNVDADYQGLVTARREFFSERGLTSGTHYIASTGIQGASADVRARVLMDAYAISGVRGDQVEYLSAPDHLCPTHLYGVTFERGVSVAYRDRKRIDISGTASIDSAGDIVHPGDVIRQLDRTLTNIEALLRQADATLQDVCSFIVYVRDPSDLGIVQQVAWDRLGPAPVQVVVAPVCRPAWLIEIECQAIVDADRPALPDF